MDVTEKSSSSFKPIRPSAIPKLSAPDTGEVDENDLNNDKMGSKLQNPKKPSTKHFMSPTISAASKAVVQRKKILADRNEASTFSDTQIENSPKFDLSTIPVNPRIGSSSRSSSYQVTPLYNSVSESDDDEQNTFVARSSLKPYDPVTNYLSPRPEFLRFKPNRRREIFLRRKSEIREEKDGFGVGRSVLFDSQKAMDNEELSGDPHSSLESSSQEGSVKQEEERINKSDDADADSDEEMEEFEEKGGIWKGVLKSMLVFVVLFLSTIYISSMNSPTPSPTLQAIRGLKDEYIKIQNHIFEAVTMKVVEVGTESVNLRSSDGIENLNMVQDDHRRSVESTYELVEVVELENAQIEDVCDAELEKTEEEASDQFKGTEIAHTQVEYDHELDDYRKGFDQLKGTETVESEEVYDDKPGAKWEGYDQLQGTGTVESEDVCDHELMNMVKSFHQFQGIKIGEKPESYEDFQAPFTSSSVESNSGYEQVENGDQVEPVDGIVSDVAAGKEEVVEDELKRVQDINSANDKIVIPERMHSEATKSNSTNPEVENLIEGLKTVLFPEAVMGFSIFFMIVACLALGLHLRWKRTSAKNDLAMGRMLSESAIEEKIIPVLPPHMEEEHIEKVVPSVNPSSLIRSFQSRAPTVELLAEFEVGEVSSSLKSCGMKSKMMENEESDYSISQGKKGSWSKANEFSTMNTSPSYGSFTAEKKRVQKEEGKDREVRMAVTTPVRRSTRIRNRSVTSP